MKSLTIKIATQGLTKIIKPELKKITIRTKKKSKAKMERKIRKSRLD